MAKHNAPPLLSSEEIRNWAPYSLNHLRRLETVGQFPRRVRIGANRVAWVREEVEAWLEQRIAERTLT
jgi:prophage regulatory protein